MRRFNVFNLIFYCIFLSCSINVNAESSSEIDNTISDTSNASEYAVEVEEETIDSNISHIPNTTLNRNASSTNTSDLFAKVLDMEEQLQELNGRLQKSEHLNSKLIKKLNNLSSRVENIALTNAKTNRTSKVSYQSSNTRKLLHSIKLIEVGKNTEAIKILKSCLQNSKTQKKQLESEGEIYHWLAKAYMNQKSPEKAAYYFTKSYRYYSGVKSNNVLVGLIEALASNKKYNQICPLLNKLDAKYLSSLTKPSKIKLKVGKVLTV